MRVALLSTASSPVSRTSEKRIGGAEGSRRNFALGGETLT